MSRGSRPGYRRYEGRKMGGTTYNPLLVMTPTHRTLRRYCNLRLNPVLIRWLDDCSTSLQLDRSEFMNRLLTHLKDTYDILGRSQSADNSDSADTFKAFVKSITTPVRRFGNGDGSAPL